MTIAAGRADPASIWLGGGIALAIALAALPWLPPIDQAPAVPPSASSLAPSTQAMAAALPGLEAFPETNRRPLFTPDRRPAPRLQPSAATTVPGIDRLVGIVSLPGARRAMLSGATGLRTVVPGDAVNDWTVQAIEAERVVLSRGMERIILSIGEAVPAIGSAARGQPGGGNQ